MAEGSSSTPASMATWPGRDSVGTAVCEMLCTPATWANLCTSQHLTATYLYLTAPHSTSLHLPARHTTSHRYTKCTSFPLIAPRPTEWRKGAAPSW